MFTKEGYFQRESKVLNTTNPLVSDFSRPVSEITEAVVNDLKVDSISAIYPMINCMHSNKLTKNYTLYPAESLVGNQKHGTGYSSFIQPYGKPIIREHRLQGSMFGDEADVPMGRAIAASYSKRGKDESLTPHKYGAGFVEGDGVMSMIAAVTEPEAIRRVLGHQYHTVSIGSVCSKVTESISGIDLVKARKEGTEAPSYERGQVYNGQLSWWNMGPIEARELSMVNNPSEVTAGVVKPDLGIEGVRLLLADKKTGTKEFNFYDAKTGEKISWNMEQCVFDASYIEDSVKVGTNIWWIQGKETAINHGFEVKESVKELQVGDEVLWSIGLEGKITSIESGKFQIGSLNFEATEADKYAQIETKSGRKVAHKLSILRKK